ncbi:MULTISPECIES: hypothetical protein [Paenibacillus]|uniref:Uncharacterized protein n=1 Tax=Paenibacillus naphthalenovorans TaxID=162209 RepID=A0A0U2W1M9_9BACL|nr:MULTISPECIES: hypothetical protein [Paenibacillus]ALS22452.1 hypothetical protein IJ22_20780 [Paenibacillus naphthalenovorans]NTZ16904.1 hypothetical protein [Paenibacillus sp. JMULE4]GCL70240.1 hypothetical protein PN4B1_01400 [Paenibacillus naphthalenovorans]SDH88000.1 hypothetical protein SAMN05421868_101424 [Paenibacillus naphthalenovorans]
MSDSTNINEPRKISLADAIKNKLAQKKQGQHEARANAQQRAGSDAVMRSQNNKKPNNQRRRTGGS